MLRSLKQHWITGAGVCLLMMYGIRFLFARNSADQEETIRTFFNRMVRFWKLNVTVEGAENADPSRQYVIIANHQSQMDIPVLYHTIPVPMRMAAKHQLFRIPFFGYFLRHGGFIPVYRGDKSAAIKSLAQAKALFGKGLSVFIAPEGTRSKTGEFLPFKKGAFVMAIEHQKPILPIVLIGTRDVVKRGSLKVYPEFPVRVKILPPIPVEGLTYSDRDQLISRAWQTMSEAYEEGVKNV